jgi:hypothetical protein
MQTCPIGGYAPEPATRNCAFKPHCIAACLAYTSRLTLKLYMCGCHSLSGIRQLAVTPVKFHPLP